MSFNIRTTIFMNICILMCLAILLIGLVVSRVTEKEIFRQRMAAGEHIFSSIQAGVTGCLSEGPAPAALKRLMVLMVQSGACASVLLVDADNRLVAGSDSRPPGQTVSDRALRQAAASRGLYKKIYREGADASARLEIAAPFYLKSRPAGVLKAVFPLQDVQQSIKNATKMILLYVLFDAAVLVAFGTFMLSRYLEKPMKKLIRLTEDISEGNLDGIPLFLSEKNEIGKLSTALKTMSEKLKEERSRVREQLKALEEKNRQLQQAHQELLQSEKLASVGRLAAGIAHEIGNPVGILMGYVHMLRDPSIDPEDRRDYLGRLESEADRVNKTIRELLDYAQPSSREVREVDLNAVVRDSWSLVSYQKEFKNISTRLQLADDLPRMRANEQQIRQLLVNLILNARDAMPEGGVLTLATGRATVNHAERVRLTVRDTGEGITAENQGKVFDPFFTTKEQGRGTGLGLANVHRIVEIAGGRIRLTSAPDEGTVFDVCFPAVQ